MASTAGRSPVLGDAHALSASEVAARVADLEGWSAPKAHHLAKRWRTKSFSDSWSLVGRIAAVAEHEGHHPDVAFGWGWVQVTLWTHAVDGLTDRDFAVASRIDQVARSED